MTRKDPFRPKPIGAIVTAGMVEAPTGTVTLLFTDIEGSTRLLQRAGDLYADLLAEHRRLLRSAFEVRGGYEVSSEGDAFFVTFSSANDAVAAAAEAQQALAGHEWPEGHEIRVRIGLHTGEPRVIEGRYVGLDVHRAARVMASGHGGQVLVSQTTRDMVDDRFSLSDLGEHRLKDLSQPQGLYQLQIEGLPNEFPALKTLENRPTNLPVQPTLLIGREKELEEIEALLCRNDVRLLTLTGTGGTGKTRLALQAAADMIEEFASGVFFVSLSPITDVELVVPTVAQTLGLRELGGEPLIETLAEYLYDKRMLLVLDNFEQVVTAAPSVASLLRSVRGLKVLVTSRTPLHISGERTYEVPPLALPDPARLPEISALTQYEAVALFIERAQAAKSGFTVTNENAPAIAEICVRLDGLPLALELAAARIPVLPPQTLLAHLDQRLRLLTGGAQDLEERQRTLRATIDWSYDLLSQQEKTLFACLGIFVGGSRLDAAEAVCNVASDDGFGLLDGMTSLLEKNLLLQKEDADGEPRFWMLETIREYARERATESVRTLSTPRAHARYYRQFAEDANALPSEGDEGVAMARLDQDRDNIRSALDLFRREDEHEQFLQLAAALMNFWFRRGDYREGMQTFDLALTMETDDRLLREETLRGAFWFAAFLGDLVKAKAIALQRVSNAEALRDDGAIAGSLASLARVATLEGDYERARELQEARLEIARRSDDKQRLALSLADVGDAALHTGDYEEARAVMEEALTIERESGARYDFLLDLIKLGWIALEQNESSEAEALCLEALPSVQELGYPDLVAFALGGLAAAAMKRGDLLRAARLAAAEETIYLRIGVVDDPWSQEFRDRHYLGLLRRRNVEEHVAAAWAHGREMTDEQAVAYALEELSTH
jgi:predicted ATPase/class 3 adenylate cyclase